MSLILGCTVFLAGGWPVLLPGGAQAASALQTAPVQTIRPDFAARDTAAQPGGWTLVFGIGGPDYVLARYAADGRRDASFGDGGEVRLARPARNSAARDQAGQNQAGGPPEVLRLAVQPDGHVLALAGHTLLRLRPDGQPDPAFGAGGRVTLGDPSVPQALAALPDGRVLIVGGTRELSPDPAAPTSALVVSRLLPNGQPDPAFGAGGQVVTALQDSASAYSVLPLAGGGVLVGGTALSFTPGTYSRWVVARYTAGGALDPSFGVGGVAAAREDRFAVTRPGSLAVDAVGRVLVAGFLSSGACELVRVLPGGTRDPAWVYEASGRLHVGSVSDPGAGVSLALLPGGNAALGGCAATRLDAAGQEEAQPVVLRLTVGGGLDRQFGSAGLQAVADSARLKLTPGGRLLVGLDPVSEFRP